MRNTNSNEFVMEISIHNNSRVLKIWEPWLAIKFKTSFVYLCPSLNFTTLDSSSVLSTINGSISMESSIYSPSCSNCTTSSVEKSTSKSSSPFMFMYSRRQSFSTWLPSTSTPKFNAAMSQHPHYLHDSINPPHTSSFASHLVRHDQRDVLPQQQYWPDQRYWGDCWSSTFRTWRSCCFFGTKPSS